MSRSTWLIVGAIAGAAVLAVAGTIAVGLLAGFERSSDASSTPEVSRQPQQVTYRVVTTGNQRIQLTYENATGNTEQTSTTTQDALWEKSFRPEPGAFLYVSAQLGDAIGSIDCEIEVDGEIIEQAHSSGAFSIATCSGSLP